MVDLKDLRENPQKYREAARKKRITVDIDSLIEMENKRRALDARRQQVTAEKNGIGKQIGQLAGQLKKASGEQQKQLQEEMKKAAAALDFEKAAQLRDALDDLRRTMKKTEKFERLPYTLPLAINPDHVVALRPGQPGVVTVSYANTGETDIGAPVLTLAVNNALLPASAAPAQP